MSYFLITFSALLFSMQFMFSESYSRESGNGLISVMRFSCASSFIGFLLLLFINRGHLLVTPFSAAVAFVYGASSLLLSYATIKAFEYANLSVYSVFSMIGGMTLPFIYGIFCGEPLRGTRIICLLLIAFSIILSVKRGNNSKKAIKYYIMVFVLNGMSGVFAKLHQSYPEINTDNESFMMLMRLSVLALSLGILLVKKESPFKMTVKGVLYSSGGTVLNNFGNLLLLTALLTLPASVQYPIVTGGTIVFSTIIVLIKREKITKREIGAAAIAFIASAFMMIA